jgi:DNA-binding CsgD family transcriptional regulator
LSLRCGVTNPRFTKRRVLRWGAQYLLSSGSCRPRRSPPVATALQDVRVIIVFAPVVSGFVNSTLSARRPRLVSSNASLSRREGEVHDLLMQNMSNKEIAKRLQMGERTVKFHVSHLLRKHGVKRRADLILLSAADKRRA